MSQMNSASFILNGKQVDIAAKDLMSHAEPLFVQEVCRVLVGSTLNDVFLLSCKV